MAEPRPARTLFRFAGFTLSTGRRSLSRGGAEIPLIPRYFDLLVLLIERRREAISRGEILDLVWRDVVVSDGALSQAVRTLRRVLGDDPREPIFIRTVSRHGYQFVHPDVVEAGEEAAEPVPPPSGKPAAGEPVDRFEVALARLLQPVSTDPGEREAERREAAETLHQMGTAEALRRLDRRPGHEMARAVLRDARWDVPGAGDVPILGTPGSARSFLSLVLLRAGRAARLASSRWGAAALGGAMAGFLAGLAGGIAMTFSPEAALPASVPVALSLVGAAIGAIGAAGVGAGLAAAETLARSFRGPALVAGGALGGGIVGVTVHLLGRLTLEGIFGHDLSTVGGGFEGILLGGAAGLGYALSAPRPHGGGMATPRRAARLRTALVTGLFCAAGALIANLAGGHLGGTSLDFMARSFPGSQVGITPLARLLGEGEVGPITRTVLALYEGGIFGVGLILGFTRRPRARR